MKKSEKANKNRQYVAASRDRDAASGIVRVDVRVPKNRREEILKIAAKFRNERSDVT